MHIDHKQFTELLTETSGIEADKVEKQVAELVEEINQALTDGEAYEIDGFGIFSGIGNRVLFIPSKELETEINFKYVGMEPIELEADQVQVEEKSEDDPFAELQELDSESEPKRDPFAGLIEDFDKEEEEQTDDAESDHLIFGVEAKRKLTEEGEDEPRPGPEEWGIEAHKEDNKGANKLLSSLMGEAYTEPEEEEPKELKVEDEASFDDIFGEDVEKESEAEAEEPKTEEFVSGLDAELSSLMSDDAHVKSSEEMDAGLLDDDLSDIFGDLEDDEPEDEDSEEEALAEQTEDLETEEETLEDALDELISESEEEEPEEEEIKNEQELVPDSEEPTLEEVSEEIDMDDFDDPFMDLEGEFSEGEEELEEQEDIVPVITNISSGIESPKKEEPKPKEEKKQKPPKSNKEPRPVPILLWIVLALVLITGTTVGLGYFSVINIPGITPQVVTVNPTVVTPPPSEPVQEQTQAEQPVVAQQEEETTSAPPTAPVQEQEASAEVPISNSTAEVPAGQNKYGLMGVVNQAANDGYTIVLYSLSVQSNAMAKQQELNTEGYRTLVTPISSERYGTLWRVSIGQFATLTDAAIASENMDAKFKQSYFIKRITN